jgi:cytochrome c553
MKKSVAFFFIFMGVSSFVFAAGDAGAGKAKAALCSGCHGADGNSTIPAFPKLAGQNTRYLVKQMQDVKEGRRSVAAMTGMLDGMSNKDMEDIAAYFSSQNSSIGKAKAELVSLGEKLYRSGNKETGVAACTACHSPTGSGNAPAGYPALSGQHAEYTAAQLKAFRSGERNNDGDSKIMRTNAFRLNDNEIEALASYISGLH